MSRRAAGGGEPARTGLVKVGGELVADRERSAAILRDVRALLDQGWRLALVHGGGPQLSSLQARMGITPTLVAGRRVTDPESLELVKMALAGQVSVDLVASAQAAGLRAVGISGISDGTITAVKRPPRVMVGAGPEPVDYGLVGDVTEIRTELIAWLWAGGFVPVLNTLGLDRDVARRGEGVVYNINADTVASALARALGVAHLFLVSNVPGVLTDRADPSSRLPSLTPVEATRAIERGVIQGGMIPKVQEALDSVAAGIAHVHILPGEPGALAQAAQAPGSVGTVLRPGPLAEPAC